MSENKQTAPTMRMIRSNGINMRIAEMGSGPLVILVHGWPESWYSWRHQLPALAAAGYRVVAPDMRGYGGTDKPLDVQDYDIHHLCADITGLIDALGETTAVIVGHDWGAIVAWQCMFLHPDRFTALVALSVPYGGRGEESLVKAAAKSFGDNFFYILYFQESGLAEQEFDADPHGILSRLYLSPDAPREARSVTDPNRAAAGWIPRLGAAIALPDWLTQADLDYYVSEFSAAGFRGGINYYRNIERNWQTTAQLANAQVLQPVLFIAGAKDMVLRGANAEQLTKMMAPVAPDLQVTIIADVGHWVQQEVPAETNAAILAFLAARSRHPPPHPLLTQPVTQSQIPATGP